MANTTGTLSGSLILQRALELVFTVRPVLRRISLNLRDLDSGAVTAKYNQAVYTRKFGIPTVQDFGTGAGETADTDVSITINKWKEVHYAFTPTEYNATDRDLVTEHALPLATAVANHIVDAIAANWTEANFSRSLTKAAGWDYEHLTDTRKDFQDNGVPDMNRFYIGNADVYKAFLNDTLIVAALNNPNNAGAIASGRLPEVAGFGIMEYPDCPTTGNLVGFAGTPNAVLYAHRVPKNPEELLPGARYPGLFATVTEPTTGLSLVATQWIAADTLVANTRLCWFYGTAVGDSNNGVRIVTA